MRDSHLDFSSPTSLLLSLLEHRTFSPDVSAARAAVAVKLISQSWTWDAESALAFSRVSSGGFDPKSLFSVCRRFHLLNDVESNKTAELLECLRAFGSHPERFAYASALVIRQNHYITEQCDSVLRAALPISQSAAEDLLDFISAEAGHDEILKRALNSLAFDPAQIPILDVVLILMETFRAIAERNLLGFSMVVDIFERTSYRESDPLADLLHKGGASVAAEQLESHRHINDAGGHENVAIGFLSSMKTISHSYGEESLRLAELLTLVIHMVSPATIQEIRGYRRFEHPNPIAIA